MVVALLLAGLLDETASFLPAGALEAFRDDLDLTYAQAGGVLAAMGPGGLVGNVATVASDYVSRRLVVVGGALLYAASMLCFAVGHSFGVLLAGGFLVGVAATALVDGCEVALTDLAGDRLRTLLARANLAGAVGDLLGPLVLIAVTAAGLNWRAAFGAAAALLVAYAGLLARHPLPAPAPTREAPGPAGAVLVALRDPRVWVLGLVGLLMNPLDEPLLGFAIAFLEGERGLSTAAANLAGLAAMTGGVLTYLVLAPRLDGRDDAGLLAASGLLMAASVVAFALLPGPLAVAALFGAGVGLNLAWLVVQHRTLTLRPGAAGTTKAVVSSFDPLGFALPVLVGAVTDAWGLPAGIAVFATLPCVISVLAFGLRTAPPGRRRP